MVKMLSSRERVSFVKCGSVGGHFERGELKRMEERDGDEGKNRIC